MRTSATALVFVLAALAGCGGTDTTESPGAAASPSETETPLVEPVETETPSVTPTTVEVVVVTTNVLDQSCEALSGTKRGLHSGAAVTLEDASGVAVAQGRLGEPPTEPTDAICAWGATMEAELDEDEKYAAVVAERFMSAPTVGWKLAIERLVIEAR